MIKTWFPKTLYIKTNLHLNELSLFSNIIENKFREYGYTENGMQRVKSSHVSFNKFHEVSELSNLVDTIWEHSRLYLNRIGYSKETIDSLSILNMWSNISSPGDYLFPHIHSGSLLSGVFYVEGSPEDKIKFFNDWTDTIMSPDFYNEYNYKYCEYPCDPGTLILFKSNFLHGTEAQKAKRKIAVSFNIG